MLNSKGRGTKYGNNLELHIKAGGGSGVNFACLAHMKVPFITDHRFLRNEAIALGVKKLLSFEGWPSDNFSIEIYRRNLVKIW